MAIFARRSPVVPKEPPVGEVEASPGSAGRGRSVLVVDDREEVRKIAELILSSAGFEVAQAADGGEALALIDAREQPVDLALLDLNLPGLDGRRLATEVAVVSPGTRILYMSGAPLDQVADRGVFPDAWFIQKPFAASDLVARVLARLA